MPLPLNSLRYENSGAPVLVILHGLLGSSRNWTTIGRALQDKFDVHVLDLRNHGSSPHADSMRWSELVADLLLYLDDNGLNEHILMGHSLGGKVAMRFASEYSERVEKLIIVDIAAKAYLPHLDTEFRAMKSIDLSELSSRKEAEEALESLVPDWGHRQFVLTNLVRDKITGGFFWQVNVEGLHANLPHMRMNALREGDSYEGPTLLVRGGNSRFIEDPEVGKRSILGIFSSRY